MSKKEKALGYTILGLIVAMEIALLITHPVCTLTAWGIFAYQVFGA